MSKRNPYVELCYEKINKRFPDKESINAKELGEYLGICQESAASLVTKGLVPGIIDDSNKRKRIFIIPKLSLAIWEASIANKSKGANQ